jgi:putative ABC transport system ATP-binding protein
METEFALQLRGVAKTYGDEATGVRALDGVDVAFPRGSFTAIMGPSGSGKTTLLNCAAGLERVDAGEVWIGGTSVGAWNQGRLTRFRRDHLGFVFQDFHLMPYLTAEQNIALPLRLARRRVDRARVASLLDQVGLDGRAGRLPGQLSGGQQQRVAIARAMVAAPDVLFADEPTGALDTASTRQVLGLLRAAVDHDRQTTVMVTHDPIAASYADAVVFLVDGRVGGTMSRPTADAVAARMTHLGEVSTRVSGALSGAGR